MRRKICIILSYCILLLGCSKIKSSGSTEKSSLEYSFPFMLESAIAGERQMGSKDISYAYTVGIDTSLYPNKRKFKLMKVKRFSRSNTEEGMEYSVEYFATSDDSVRTILHEWSVSNEATVDLIDPKSPQKNIINAFDKKFATLFLISQNLLGEPTLNDIRGTSLEESERDDVKWQGFNRFNAYLLMFKRDLYTYRQIRLIVYLK